jgi:hypothetical protein
MTYKTTCNLKGSFSPSVGIQEDEKKKCDLTISKPPLLGLARVCARAYDSKFSKLTIWGSIFFFFFFFGFQAAQANC